MHVIHSILVQLSVYFDLYKLQYADIFFYEALLMIFLFLGFLPPWYYRDIAPQDLKIHGSRPSRIDYIIQLE